MQQNKREENIKSSKVSNNRKFATFLYLFIAIIFLPGIIAYTNYWQNQLEIKEIKIVGNKYIPQSEIQNLIYRFILANKLSSINFNFIKETILQNPYVRKVNFITTYPGIIVISLDVKNILAIGKNSKNQELFITEEGETLPKRNYRLGFSLPKVDLSKLSDENYKEDIENIAVFLKNYYIGQSKKIQANSIWKDSEGICFSILNGIIVKIGNLQDLQFKFHKFDVFMSQQKKTNTSLPNYIDLRWSNQVVVY